MVAKKNFSQGNRSMPYRKPQFNNNQFLNASQIPDNPGYLDFNNMDLNQSSASANTNNQMQTRKKTQKGKQKNKQQNNAQQRGPQFNGVGGWNKNRNRNNQQQPQQQQRTGPNKFQRGPNAQRNFQGNGPPMRGNNVGRMRMMPPIPPPRGFQGPPMMPPMTPMPPPHMRQMRAPIPPPLPPVGAIPTNGPPFLRRSARRNGQGGGGRGVGGAPFKKQGFPVQMPPMIPPMMGAGGPPPPLLPRMPPMPFSNAVNVPNVGKIKKPNSKIVKKIVKGKSTIKTLKNLQNQYPLDKPWVTDEIRAEHEKKVKIENQLKGKKDDDLFAQFKTQRDKFVGMYESARDEHLKKEAAEVKTKDANDKQVNNKTAGKSGKGNEKN